MNKSVKKDLLTKIVLNDKIEKLRISYSLYFETIFSNELADLKSILINGNMLPNYITSQYLGKEIVINSELHIDEFQVFYDSKWSHPININYTHVLDRMLNLQAFY